MKIYVNGKEVEIAKQETVSQAIKEFISSGEEIVIHNGKYLSLEDCNNNVVCDEDRIDIIKFLAGG